MSFEGDTPMASTPVEAYSRVIEVRGEGGRSVIVLDGGATVAADQITALRRPPGA